MVDGNKAGKYERLTNVLHATFKIFEVWNEESSLFFFVSFLF